MCHAKGKPAEHGIILNSIIQYYIFQPPGWSSKLHVAVEMSCNPVWFGAIKMGTGRWFPQRRRCHPMTLARMLTGLLGLAEGPSNQILEPNYLT